MIIWSGLGFLGLLIPFAGAFVAALLAKVVLGQGYATLHTWPSAIGVLVGAFLVYLLSVRLDPPGRLLVDPATGQRLVLKSRHTLFWIPLRWIALMAAVIGLLLFLLPANRAGTAGTQHTSVTAPALPVCAGSALDA